MMGVASLMRLEQVQEELKLTEEQKGKLSELAEQQRAEMGDMFRGRDRENREELRSLVAYIIEKIIGAHDRDIIDKVLNVIIKGVGYAYSWPGNVRELEQCIRRILLHGEYSGEKVAAGAEAYKELLQNLDRGSVTAQELLSHYCFVLYNLYGSYEDVALIANLDSRTVKKYIK